MNYPPFEPPLNFKKATRWAERKVPDGYSDGDQRHWPPKPYRPSANEFYLCALGQRWAEKDGVAQPGIQYFLDKLPDGYAMFEVDQPAGSQVYKRLFGHPSGHYYDSALKFEPHFLWLMSGKEGECECKHCGHKKPAMPRKTPVSREVTTNTVPLIGRSPTFILRGNDSEEGSSRSSSMARGIGSKRSQRQVKQAGAPFAVDEEGTEDIYKDCVRKLENARGSTSGIEIDLTEDGSIDWKADRQVLPPYLTQIEQQHSFIPRVGELVLWCPIFLDNHYLMLDPTNSEYKFYSFEQKCFHGFPAWRGGVVAAAPSASIKNGPIDFPDILEVPTKKTSFNTAGFRIETMPDPNDDVDKSMSKQYRYVPLRNIRPLSQWRLLVQGIPPQKLHPSVTYALTCMTSLSLLEKCRFNGDWPNARIFCKGIYLGSELITVGDAIRISPSNVESAPQPEILIVSSIRYNLLDMRLEHVRAETPQLCSRAYVSFVGQGYTTNLDRLRYFRHTTGSLDPLPDPLDQSQIKPLFRCVGADVYGKWYPWHGPRQSYEVSHERVLGRLYEGDAVRLWTGQRQLAPRDGTIPKPSLSFDAESIIAGRKYASATDARLPEPNSPSDINWHFADSRAEGLAVATVNGIDVGRYYDIRTPPTLKQWRMQVKIADGQQIAPDVEAEYIRDLSQLQLYTGARRGRPPGSKVVDGKLILPNGREAQETYDDNNDNERSKPLGRMVGAALVIDLDDSSQDGQDNENNDDNDDEGEEDTDQDEILDEHDVGVEKEDVELVHKFQAHQRPRSKAEIMNSVEVIEDTMDDASSEEDSSWLYSRPLIRGGTEESEGGDYRE